MSTALGGLALTLLVTAIGQEQEQEPRAWPDFPAFVWRLDAPGTALAPELLAPFGGVNVEGASKAEWALEQDLDFYVGHAPGRNALHLDSERDWYRAAWDEYWTERDPQILVRQPCLSEPETLEALSETLDRCLSARGGRHGLGISLGDEVGLTPYGAPLDLCTCAACRTAFARFVRGSSPWRGLPFARGDELPYPDTDSARLAWIDGDPQHVAPWLARRAFHTQAVASTLEQLATHVRESAPGVRVGLFGQSGRTAFGDVDLPAVLPWLDFIEVYRILDARELIYTLRGPRQRSLLTLFRDPEAPDAPAWLAWEHWLRGGDGLVLWSDRDLAQHPAYHARLADAVADLRDLRRSSPDWRPRPAGVALIHSPDSLALSWLRDALNDGPTWMRRFPSYQNEHGTRELALRALLRALEDSGFLPGALPLDAIGAATRGRFPVLVANHLILLDEPEITALRNYVRAGGVLLVHGDLGLFDRRGQRREADEAWKKIDEDSGRLQRLDLDPARYLRERWSSHEDGDYPPTFRRRLLDLSQPAQHSSPPWSIQGTRVPWLRASQRVDESTWLCAALPNASSAEERATLEFLSPELQIADGFEIEFLYPRFDEDEQNELRLRPGDALVFRVRRP